MDLLGRLLVVRRKAKRLLTLIAHGAETWQIDGSFKRLRWFADRISSMKDVLDEIAGALARDDREAAREAASRLLEKAKKYILLW